MGGWMDGWVDGLTSNKQSWGMVPILSTDPATDAGLLAYEQQEHAGDFIVGRMGPVLQQLTCLCLLRDWLLLLLLLWALLLVCL
jgi:hypothetical protein